MKFLIGISTALVSIGVLAEPAAAAVAISISQSGANIVVTGSGGVDISDLTFAFTEPDTSGVNPNYGAVLNAGVADYYTAVYGGAGAFGSGGYAGASSSSGSAFIFSVGGYYVGVPTGYQSGNSLSFTETFANATLSSLGITPGSHTYTFGSGTHADSITVNAIAPAPASVPEPMSYSLAVSGLVGLAMRRSVARA